MANPSAPDPCAHCGGSAVPLSEDLRQALWAAVAALDNEIAIAKRNATQRGRYHLQEAAAVQLRRAQRAEEHRDAIRALLHRVHDAG